MFLYYLILPYIVKLFSQQLTQICFFLSNFFISSFVPETYILDEDIMGNIKDLSADTKNATNYLDTLKIGDFITVGCKILQSEESEFVTIFSDVILYDTEKEVYFFYDRWITDYSKALANLDKNTILTAYKLIDMQKYGRIYLGETQ